MPSTIKTNTPSKKRKKSSIADLRKATKKIKLVEDTTEINIIPPHQSSSVFSITNTNTSTYIQTKLNFSTLTSNSSSDQFFTLKTDCIHLSLRSITSTSSASTTPTSSNQDNFIQPDYLKQIGISLRTNFNIKSRRKKQNNQSIHTSATSQLNRRKLRSSTNSVTTLNSSPCLPIPSLSTENLPNNDKVLGGYLRCYIEDFMSINRGHDVIILIPKLDNLLSDMSPLNEIQIGKASFRLFKGEVINSPKADSVQNGITNSDLIKGFGNDNYGSYIKIGHDSILLTWNEVMNGKQTGIQIWRKTEKYRDVYSLFKSRRKTKDGLLMILNTLFHEVVGDRIQLYHLLTCYYRAMLTHSSTLLLETRNLLAIYEPVVLEGVQYHKLLTLIDERFKVAIEKTYCQFCSINKAILSNEDINDLISKYKTFLPRHYETMRRMMVFDKKESLQRNKHLTIMNVYNRQLFHQFLSQVRIVNSHNCIHYAIVSAGACYGRGISGKALKHSTHAGISSNMQSMLNRVKHLNSNMNKKIQEMMLNKKYFVVALDNNQKGHNRKYQRDGSSNDFIKVTGRFFRSCDTFDYPTDTIKNINEKKKVLITYINQAIPSMYNLPCFERVLLDTNVNKDKNIARSILSTSANVPLSTTIDITGLRVKGYVNNVECCDVVKHVISPYLTNYFIGQDGFKKWSAMPLEFNTTTRRLIAKEMASKKDRFCISIHPFNSESQVNVIQITTKKLKY